MAARLTDEQKKKIIADYVESGSYRATAKRFGVSAMTVRSVCTGNTETVRKCTQKKEQNTADMLAYMESRKEQAKGIIDSYLEALADPEKLEKTPIQQIATAMGIVVDKFVTQPAENRMKEKKLEIELLKIESQMKDSAPEEDAEDNFLDALNGTAAEVWEESEEPENDRE